MTKPDTTEQWNYLAFEFSHGIDVRESGTIPQSFRSLEGRGQKGKPLQCQGERSTEG